ncbi:MAG: hypothetical protein AAF399_01900 [Bacteroidota bacterium]
MRFLTRQTVLLLAGCLFLATSGFGFPVLENQTQTEGERLYNQGVSLRFTFPDSAIKLMAESTDWFLSHGDTLHGVEAILIDANIKGNLANYKEAYDKLWQALILTDEANLRAKQAQIYIEIGRHYSFYKRRDKALEYFAISRKINQQLLEAGTVNQAQLVNDFYAFCSTYRELDEFELARKYLDSCFQFFQPVHSPIHGTYLQFELACIQTAEGSYAEALETFQSVQAWFEAEDPSYLVLFYTYLADAYRGLDQYEETETYYEKALTISDEYHMHIDFTPIIHGKLASLYQARGDYQGAYQQLETVKALDARFFDSRSDKNQSLLEIQDAFREEQRMQQELMQQQKLESLEREEDVWFLQRVILIGSFVFLAILGYLYFSYLRARHRAEKQVIRKEKELELKKTQEVLEIKNKELVASALKLVEKEEDLALLKSKIKEANGNLDVNELKKVVRSISVSNHRNWEEFEARFVAVNQDFYARLQKRFPKLTQRDLKLCALVKLNFSSKEMAKLLGISVESAHTSRYRLRKKLHLTREVNLTEFIANL